MWTLTVLTRIVHVCFAWLGLVDFYVNDSFRFGFTIFFTSFEMEIS